MWSCYRCRQEFDSNVGFVAQENWADRCCFSCHWFRVRLDYVHRGARSASTLCSQCTDAIPCKQHERFYAMSVAVEYLLHSRRTTGTPMYSPITRHEHETLQSIERKKLQDYATRRRDHHVVSKDEESMEMDEPTMVERTVLDYLKENEHPRNKRVYSVSPEEARGRCTGCHVPVQMRISYCPSCFLQSTEGRAKRARTSTEMCIG